MDTKNKEIEEYIINCDICKTTIKQNTTFKESVEGGVCSKCKNSDMEELK